MSLTPRQTCSVSPPRSAPAGLEGRDLALYWLLRVETGLEVAVLLQARMNRALVLETKRKYQSMLQSQYELVGADLRECSKHQAALGLLRDELRLKMKHGCP